MEYYSRRHGLERIFYDVQTSRSLLEPDEEFTIHSTIENHKFWFVPYVSMSENFPLGIHVPGEEKNMSQEVISLQVYAHSAATPSQQLTSTTLSSSFYLMPKQKLMQQRHRLLSQARTLPVFRMQYARRRLSGHQGRLPEIPAV